MSHCIRRCWLKFVLLAIVLVLGGIALPSDGEWRDFDANPNVGYGPLFIASQSPLQSLRLTMMPHAPAFLPKGSWRTYVGTTWVNVWAVDEGFYELDYEQLQVLALVGYGLRDDMTVAIGIRDRSQFGGEMDGLVQGFHDLFGIAQNGRDEVPRNRLSLRLYPDQEDPIVIGASDRGSFMRSVTAVFAHRVTRGGGSWPAVAYMVSAQYDLLEEVVFRGGHGIDVGVSLSLSRRFGRCYFYGVFGYSHFGSDSLKGIDLKDGQFSAMLAGELVLAPRHSLVLNVLQTEGAAEDFGAFSDVSTELTFGWKWEMMPSTMLELALIENVLSFDNSPDFGVSLALSRKY